MPSKSPAGCDCRLTPKWGRLPQATLQGSSPGLSDWGSRGRQPGVSGWDWKPEVGRGRPIPRETLSREPPAPALYQLVRGKIVSSRCWSPPQGRKRPFTPQDAPSPRSSGRRLPLIFPIFVLEEQVELVAVETGRKPSERWRVGHSWGPGLERWGRVRGLEAGGEGHAYGRG